MAARTTTRRAKAKPAPAPEEDYDEELVETEDPEDTEETEDDDVEAEEDDDLEELEEDEVSEEKPASRKKSTKATDTVTFGIRDLVALIKKETGEDTDPRALRTLIRKMARDQSGRVDRVITAGNRTRYDWTGPNDPEVRNIVKAFKAGELEADKQEKLKALKERKAAQNAAKKTAAPAPVEEDDEDEGEEEPKPTPRRRVAKKAAPAKPAARRRRAPAPVEEVEDDDELDLDED